MRGSRLSHFKAQRVPTTDGDGGPEGIDIFCFLLYLSDFPVLCINPFPLHWAGGRTWLPWYCSVEVSENNNWKVLDLSRSNSCLFFTPVTIPGLD